MSFTDPEYVRQEQYRMDKWTRAETEGCPRCGKMETADNSIDEQYSFGVYAGFMCNACAIHGYRDQCGHGMPQGNPADLDEPYDEEE